MNTIKTVGILGAGALGVMYGQLLQQALGREHVFFIADAGRTARYQRQGIYCNGSYCDFRYLSARHAQPADFILVAVKFPALEKALAEARAFVQPNTIFLSVMNGISSEERIGQHFGQKHLLHCIVHGMDTGKQGNQVQYEHLGTVVFGARENHPTEDVATVANLLTQAHIPYEISPDIMHQLWNKLMLNAGVNQVTALYGVGYGGIQEPGEKRQLMIDSMREVKQIAALEGVILTEEEIQTWLTILDGLNPQGYPSMAQDILAGRPTELELFAGTIRQLGQKHGLPTPVNDYLYQGIRALERKQERI